MKKMIIVLCLLLSLVVRVQAQDGKTEIITMPRLRLGVEVGKESFFGDINKPAMIRENQSYYYDYDYDYNSGFISEGQGFDSYYFGLKPEYQLNDRIAVAAGLRFSFTSATLNSDKDYFLWKVSENETNANYVKINNITQKNYNMGIPIEARYFTNPHDYFLRHYLIVGASWNFLVKSASDVSFQNAEMRKYTSNVLDQIRKPNVFYGCIYGGTGLKIGKANHPFGNLEVHIPIYMYGNNKSNSFIKMNDTFGIGIQFTLQIPIFRKRQLTYTVKTD